MLKEVYDTSIIVQLNTILQNNIKGKNINYTQIIVTAMEIIDKYENLNGSLKKSYIIMAIDNLTRDNNDIENNLISQENLIILKNLMQQNILSDLIDTIVNASKGNFDINKSSAVFKKKCKFLCFC
jgi:hypothetical protein